MPGVAARQHLGADQFRMQLHHMLIHHRDGKGQIVGIGPIEKAGAGQHAIDDQRDRVDQKQNGEGIARQQLAHVAAPAAQAHIGDLLADHTGQAIRVPENNLDDVGGRQQDEHRLDAGQQKDGEHN